MTSRDWQALRLTEAVQAGDDEGPLHDVTPDPSSVCIPMICGVGVAALLLSVVHPGTSLSWGRLLLLVTRLLLIAVVVSGAVAWVVWAMMRRRLPGPLMPIIVATCMGAAWIPAWVLSMRSPSVLLVAADCFCMWSLNRSVKRFVRYEPDEMSPVRSSIYGSDVLRLRVDDSQRLVQMLLPSLSAAMLAQAAVIEMVVQHYVIAAWAAGGCVAVLVWMSSGKALAARVKREPGRSVGWTVGLAFLLTVVVLLPYLRQPVFRTGFGSLLNHVPVAHAAERAASRSDSGFIGIILLPLEKPEKRIVAPASKGPSFTGSRIAEPMVIPFDGAYWYFKSPQKRPGPAAHVVRGSSIKANVRSTDRYPLLMNAHQELDTPIDLSCCRRIEIRVKNGDRRRGAIYLELSLRNRAVPGGGGAYIGTVEVPSSEGDGLSGKDVPTDEALEFPLPAGLGGYAFDEITVGIRTDPERAREGAQVAIRQFVLYP